MQSYYNAYLEAVQILSTESGDIHERDNIITILEDANSPITRKYHEKMFQSVINKAHIDFGDIPKSKGNIKNYIGYNSMTETLDVVRDLAVDAKAKNVVMYVDIVKRSIQYISELSSTYEKGFTTKTDYVALEYNSYVYFCVEATTSLIYSFVDVLKDPAKDVMDMTIKNNKVRANEFYFDQLLKFNKAQEHLGMDYRKMLEAMCEKGRNNFAGAATVVGMGAIIAVAAAVVPITRGVIYQIYNFRGKLANHLELQAEFLELNKTRVEANSALTVDKKKKVLEKQEKLVKKLRKLGDDVRVKSAKSVVDSKKEVDKDNKNVNVDSLKDEIDNSPIDIL